MRGLPASAGKKEMDRYRGMSIGVVVDCEGGYLTIPDYTSAKAHDKDGNVLKEFKGTSNHFGNFIDAVRSRKPADLHCEILEGHISSALCHMGNISYRLGKTQSPDEIRDSVKANADLAEAVGRMEQHLEANMVDLKQTPATLGVALKMDPRAERFLDNPDANQMLTREYRSPFVVPEKV